MERKGRHPQILVSMPGLDYRYPADSADEPFHVASIGKMFTAVLVGMLVEKGVVSLEDKVAVYLPQETLRGLFVYKGEDYAQQITIRQLLGHTSGAADYFEDRVRSGLPFLKDVIQNPDTRWTPEMLLDFTRTRQRAAGAPGTFHYSDTGYILLGLMIEQVADKAFHTCLHENIFTPLGMDPSYLMFYSDPRTPLQKPMRSIWLGDTEITRFQSLSCDWAGGGIVSTPHDLYHFQRALHGGRLVSERFLQEMQVFTHRFRAGIHYGLGMMEIRFEEFFFLLRGLPRLKGHIGILSTHLFHDAESDAHIIMNFGNTNAMTASFQVLSQMMRALSALKPGFSPS